MQALLGIYNLNDIEQKIKWRKQQTAYIYEKLKDIKSIKIYQYNEKEESNYFSPVILCNDGLTIAKQLNQEGIINSTGTFGLIPANERKVIQDYCNGKVDYDRMITPNSKRLFNNIIALSIIENTDQYKLDNIIENIRKIL